MLCESAVVDDKYIKYFCAFLYIWTIGKSVNILK